jgi:hypothetical protein
MLLIAVLDKLGGYDSSRAIDYWTKLRQQEQGEGLCNGFDAA